MGDVVAANLLALERGSGQMLNLGTGVGTSVNDIVRALNEVLGTAIEPVHEAPRPGEVQRIYLDATRARDLLGWSPAIPFAEGLRRTVEWHRLNG